MRRETTAFVDSLFIQLLVFGYGVQRSQCACKQLIQLQCCNNQNVTTGTNFGKRQSWVLLLWQTDLRVRDVTGLDAGEEAQIEAGRDLDGLQSHRGGCEVEGDRKDLLGVHHQGG